MNVNSLKKKKIKKTQHEELRVICDPAPFRESWGRCDISSFRFSETKCTFPEEMRFEEWPRWSEGQVCAPLSFAPSGWVGRDPHTNLGSHMVQMAPGSPDDCVEGSHQRPGLPSWTATWERNIPFFFKLLMGMSVGWSLNHHTYPNSYIIFVKNWDDTKSYLSKLIAKVMHFWKSVLPVYITVPPPSVATSTLEVVFLCILLLALTFTMDVCIASQYIG